MAQTVHLKLKIGGNDTPGESSIASLGRADTIECSAFDYGVTLPRESSGKQTGRRIHDTVKVTKFIDKTTPLILKALCMNEVCELEFMFFQPNKTGAGDEEHFYTVKLANAYVAKLTQHSEDPTLGGELAPPMTEHVEWVFQDIWWTYLDGGVEHHDSWKGEG